MFESYKNKLENLQNNMPAIMGNVAKKSAIKFVNSAKEKTLNEGLVDTGAYLRAWRSKTYTFDKLTYAVDCENRKNYASFLETGHRTKNGNRVKGHFIGDLSIKDAQEYAINEYRNEVKKYMKS